MADTERGWVRQFFHHEPVPDLYYREDVPDADFQEADAARAEQDYEIYRAEFQPVDAALADLRLDDTIVFRDKTTSVHWMWQHLVEE